MTRVGSSPPSLGILCEPLVGLQRRRIVHLDGQATKKVHLGNPHCGTSCWAKHWRPPWCVGRQTDWVFTCQVSFSPSVALTRLSGHAGLGEAGDDLFCVGQSGGRGCDRQAERSLWCSPASRLHSATLPMSSWRRRRQGLRHGRMRSSSGGKHLMHDAGAADNPGWSWAVGRRRTRSMPRSIFSATVELVCEVGGGRDDGQSEYVCVHRQLEPSCVGRRHCEVEEQQPHRDTQRGSPNFRADALWWLRRPCVATGRWLTG